MQRTAHQSYFVAKTCRRLPILSLPARRSAVRLPSPRTQHVQCSLQLPTAYDASASGPPAASHPSPASAELCTQQAHAHGQPSLHASYFAHLLQRTFRMYQHYILACCVTAAWCCMMGSSQGSLFASTTVAAGSRASSEGMAVAISSAWAGLAAGCLHTLAGADHLAALTPLTIGVSHFRASLLGALWGFGHSVGQLILGLAMVLLKDRFEMIVPAISRFGGLTVGIILVLIGVSGLVEGLMPHDHEHADGHHGHSHGGDAGGAATLAAVKEKGNAQFATFATGVVYGLHPDALFVVIPALTLPTKLAAAAYILMFVLGTITAMGSYTAVIGATSKAIEERNAWLASKLSSVASILAMLVGAAILAGEFGIALPFHLHFPGHAHAH